MAYTPLWKLIPGIYPCRNFLHILYLSRLPPTTNFQLASRHVRDTRTVAGEQNTGRLVSEGNLHLHLTATKKKSLPDDGCMPGLTPNFRTNATRHYHYHCNYCCYSSPPPPFYLSLSLSLSLLVRPVTRCWTRRVARACLWQAAVSALTRTTPTQRRCLVNYIMSY